MSEHASGSVRVSMLRAAHRRYPAREHRVEFLARGVELTTEAPSPDAIDDGVIPGRVPVALALREVARG